MNVVSWLSALLLIPCTIYASDPKVLLSDTVLGPGNTLRIEIDQLVSEKSPILSFRGSQFRTFDIGPDAKRVLIGIPLGSDPGVFPIELDKKAVASITVSSMTYEKENVSFTSEKTALMKLDHKEGLKIHRILKQITTEQLWEGVFDEPIKGRVVGEFGVKRTANGHMDRGFHKGVDLAAHAGTPILAPNSGVVALAFPFHMHGRTVIINHGQGVMTIYLHMRSYNVAPGQKIKKGQEIGKVGSTGLSTAPHVHWGIYIHGIAVDPKPWLEHEF